jgi:hypothetical protein
MRLNVSRTADTVRAMNPTTVEVDVSIVPFITSDHARRVECPVFIGLGDRYPTCDHHDEARAYASSSDVTLFILERSAHCHNTAGTRHELWDRIARWVASLA